MTAIQQRQHRAFTVDDGPAIEYNNNDKIVVAAWKLPRGDEQSVVGISTAAAPTPLYSITEHLRWIWYRIWHVVPN